MSFSAVTGVGLRWRLAATAAAFICASAASAQTPRLGTVHFPASGAAAAQPHFLDGVGWLHSFEYEEAIEAFRLAQAADPDFVLAYWGEAMAYNQVLWAHQDVEAARAALRRLAPTPEARAARAGTARERELLEAVEILYGEGERARRNLAFAEAMGRLAARYPDDHEIAAFHALALLGTVPRGLAAIEEAAMEGHAHGHELAGSELQVRVAAILQKVLDANADHPGALHYLIHVYDDPAHAPRALSAARRYAAIAPEASHALHMPAHIFVQLGMWDEAAASDEAAFAASAAWVTRRGLSVALRSYHSLSWLQYAYLQQGRHRKARETLDIIAAAAAETDEPVVKGTLASMRARFVIETGDWKEMRGRLDYGNADELFALGLSATRTGELGLAEVARDRLESLASAGRTAGRRPIVAIMARQLSGVLRLVSGDTEGAVRILEEAAAAEGRFPTPVGPPVPIKPASELLGEVLLELGRPGEAAAPFERSLQRTPNRSASVLGLARAAAGSGNAETARAQYRAFLANWQAADPDLPQVEEARVALGDTAGGTGGAAATWRAPVPLVFGAVALAAGAAMTRRVLLKRRRRLSERATARRRRRSGAGRGR